MRIIKGPGPYIGRALQGFYAGVWVLQVSWVQGLGIRIFRNRAFGGVQALGLGFRV